MVHLTFTKKAGDKLKINTSKAEPFMPIDDRGDDWIVDTVWDVKRDPWIMFYHKETTFVILVQPDKYKLENCIDGFLMLLQELLIRHDLAHKMPYFIELFSGFTVCKNNDRSSTAYMTQNKTYAYYSLNNDYPEYRVNNLYDLMISTNDVIRKKYDFKKTSLDAFIELVGELSINHTVH